MARNTAWPDADPPQPTADTFTVGARVVTPRGAGKVVRVSAKLKASHLVKLDAGGGEWSYRIEELKAAQKQTTLGPLP